MPLGRKGNNKMTTNKSVLAWIEEMKNLLNPDKVVWIDGSEEQLEALRKEACETGEMIKLNEEKLPGCYLHRTRENDVARVEDRTFIAAEMKRMQVLQITGKTHKKHIKCSLILLVVHIRVVQCMLSLIQWVLLAHLSQRLAMK